MTRTHQVLIGLAILALCCLPMVWALPNPLGAQWLKELHNAGHVPLFGLLQALALWWTLSLKRLRMHFVNKVLLVAMSVLAVGAAIEIIQPYFKRTASWEDFGRDALGVGAVSLCAVAIRYLPKMAFKGFASGAILTLAALVALLPAWPWLQAKWRVEQTFPTILDAEQAQVYRQLRGLEGGTIKTVTAPAEWLSHQSNVIALQLPANGRTPGWIMDHPHPNWAGFDQLTFKVFSPTHIQMKVALLSGSKEPVLYTFKLVNIAPGENTVTLNMHNWKRLDPAAIRGIIWQAMDLTEDTKMYFDDVQLIKTSQVAHEDQINTPRG